MTAFITGVNNVSVSIKEYRDKEITDEYLSYMLSIQNIFNTAPGSITGASYDTVINELKRLRNLAVNGFTTPAGGTQQITQQMASHINLIFKSFLAVGISPDSYTDIPDATKIQLVNDWKALSYFNLGQLITDARTKYDSVSTLIATNAVVGYDPNGNPITASSPTIQGLLNATATRSLQSMVELEYVKTGNDVIFDSLISLEQATQKTGDALNLLQQLQQTLNLVDIPSAGTFAWPPQDWTLTQTQTTSGFISGVYGQAIQDALVAAGVVGFGSVLPTTWEMSRAINLDPTKYVAAYKIFASAFFTQRLANLQAGQNITNIRISVENLMTAIDTMANDPALGGRTTANTLAFNLSRLYSQWYNIRYNDASYGATDDARTLSWLLDGQNLGVSDPAYNNRFGKVQDNLTNAIRAGESLNDTQKEGVRRYMLLFEEFYKSASAILTKLSQIIEKMAQGISR